jgi:hypothetical protein
MTDDIDGIVFEEMKTLNEDEEAETCTVPQKSSFGAANTSNMQSQVMVAPSTSFPGRRSFLLNQFSFSSQQSGISMEGRESVANKRAASLCERDDVEDDVMLSRAETESEEVEGEALDSRGPQE